MASGAAASSREKVQDHRARMRAKGMKLVQLWVPDVRQRGIEVCGLYWHFVGVVWLGLYVVLYLI